jgi:Ca-activated chloride channel family protein
MTHALPLLSDTEQTWLQGDGEQGFGSLRTARGNVPLKRLEVAARIDGLVSTVRVTQSFVNALGSREPLEATYVFPLPDRAAVTRFAMRIGERIIEGVLRERGEARREYETALAEGHRAALAEEDRSGVFTISVGNILPGEVAEVSLELNGPLAYDDGEATFRFPLVVAPRYIPGAPVDGAAAGDGTAFDTDAVPDASRITPPVLLPGFPNPVEFALSVQVHDGGLPLRNLRSSLHSIVEEQCGSGVRRLSVRPGERLNRDFILRFGVAESVIRTALQTVADADGEGGTYQLTLLPPAEMAASRRPRDVVFILDRSGSMSGWKIVAARRALARMIDTLNDADRFGLLAFDNVIETPPGIAPEQLAAATDRQRFAALEFLARLDARGGTEIAQPLAAALAALKARDASARDLIVVLLTDGQVGNEDEVLRELGPRLAGVRVFTLGIDRAVNIGFLHKLAMLGGGYTEVVESEERLDEVLAKVHRRIATPILTDVRVELPGSEVEPDSQTPRRLPDLFAGAPLIVRGRFRGAAPKTVDVRAVDSVSRPWSATMATADAPAPAIRTLWAREQVRALEDDYAIGRRDQEQLAARIVETSLKHGVLSRFTAFVAVDRSEVVNAGGERQKIIQPVELPEAWDDRFTTGALAGAAVFASIANSKGGTVRYKQGSSVRARRSAGGALHESRHSEIELSTQGVYPGGEDASAAPIAFDLTAYRQRALRMLDELRWTCVNTDAAAALATLMPQLASLVEDLRSIGASEEEFAPLRTLLDALREMYLLGLQQERAAELWAQAESVLTEFAKGTIAPLPAGDRPATGRRQRFWT